MKNDPNKPGQIPASEGSDPIVSVRNSVPRPVTTGQARETTWVSRMKRISRVVATVTNNTRVNTVDDG